MAISFQEIAGQTSQGISGYNRIIRMDYTDLVNDDAPYSDSTKTGKGTSTTKGIREFNLPIILKGVFIEKTLVYTYGLAFDGTKKPASIIVQLGRAGDADAYMAVGGAIGLIGTSAASGATKGLTTHFATDQPYGNIVTQSAHRFEKTNNTTKMLIHVETTANDKDLTTATKGTIYILLSVVDWKDLDAMANPPTYSGR